MNLTNSIEEFKEKYKSFIDAGVEYLFFSSCSLSMHVLEYYIENYDDIYWNDISSNQPLKESFIIKYSDKLNWYKMMSNTNDIEITYNLLESNLYRYNLYKVSLLYKHMDIIDILIKKYPHKYQIDKLSYEINR